MINISILTPVFNEEENIEECWKAIKDLFRKFEDDYNYEHIFIDNCSTDESLKNIKQISQNDKNVKILVNNQNYGILPSIFNALNYCNSDYTLVCFAADLQDPTEFLNDALNLLKKKNLDIIYAIRDKRDESFAFKYLKKSYYLIARLISKNTLKPNVNILQLISDNVRKEILQVDSNNPFIPFLLQANSFKKEGIQSEWKKRKRNYAKNNFFSLLKEAKNAICNYSNLGSTLSFSLSIIFFLFSSILFLFNIIPILLNIFLGSNSEITAGIPTLIIFNLIAFSAVFLILGVLSENINHLLDIKIGKKVRVKEKINFD